MFNWVVVLICVVIAAVVIVGAALVLAVIGLFCGALDRDDGTEAYERETYGEAAPHAARWPSSDSLSREYGKEFEPRGM